MNYPLKILKDVENVQLSCVKNGFQSESDKIEKTKALPLKMAITLIEFASNNKTQKLLDLFR